MEKSVPCLGCVSSGWTARVGSGRDALFIQMREERGERREERRERETV